MKIITSDRRSGKTTKLIELLKENPDMVVIVPTESGRVTYSYAGIDKSRVITVGAALNGALRGRACKIAIDDVELILSRLLNTTDTINVITATATHESLISPR